MKKQAKKTQRFKYDDGGFHLTQFHAHGPSIVGSYHKYLECRGVPHDSLQEICNYLNEVYSVAAALPEGWIPTTIAITKPKPIPHGCTTIAQLLEHSKLYDVEYAASCAKLDDETGWKHVLARAATELEARFRLAHAAWTEERKNDANRD